MRIPFAGRGAILAACLSLVIASDASALRVMTYNILNYSAGREALLRSVVGAVQPDVLVVEEILSQGAVDRFLDLVLDELDPDAWESAPFDNGRDTDNALFYRTDKASLLGHFVIDTALRDIDEWTIRPAGYLAPAANLRIYAVHLKASQGSENEGKRLAEVTQMRNRMETFPAGEHYLVLGDFNIYRSTESAYWYMTGAQFGLAGVVDDPIDREGNWHVNPAFADIHTQSPRVTQFGGGANGGMDDRFDLILAGPSLLDGQGFEILAATYEAYGQDGMHYNGALNVPPYSAVDSTMAQTLHDASDHLPVFADLQLPDVLVGVDPFSVASGGVSVWPNPFRSAADLSFEVPASGRVDLTIYDVRGRAIRTLVSASLPFGEHRHSWNGFDDRGRDLAPGVYFVRLTTERSAETRKIVRIR